MTTTPNLRVQAPGDPSSPLETSPALVSVGTGEVEVELTCPLEKSFRTAASTFQ